MKVKDLEEILEKLPKDFDLKVTTQKRISDEILKTMSYPYPYEYNDFEIKLNDIGWSSKIISFIVDLDKPLD